MIKYIKTKDNKIVKVNVEGGIFTSKYEVVGELKDNIEELCDNFLVEYTNGEHMMFHDFYHLQRHHELYNQDYHHVSGRYGCIWVAGKGLIYVAKMNDKGELELI